MAYLIPWLAVAAASFAVSLPLISGAPVMPPLGLMVLIGWRQLQPGLLPIWAGLPLGLVDDMFSGQPMGSAVLLWSLIMLMLDVIEGRFPWRNFAIEWLVAAGFLTAYLAATTGLANASGAVVSLWLVAPQMVLTVLLYPVVGRLVAWLDRFRLMRYRVLRRRAVR